MMTNDALYFYQKVRDYLNGIDKNKLINKEL